jgi:hypothetical protein
LRKGSFREGQDNVKVRKSLSPLWERVRVRGEKEGDDERDGWDIALCGINLFAAENGFWNGDS